MYLRNIHVFYRYTDKASVISAIGNNVPYRGGELTNVIDLLTVVDIITGVFSPVIGDRLLDQNVMILVSDGAPNFPSFAYALVSAIYQLTRQVAVFVVCARLRQGVLRNALAMRRRFHKR